MIYSEGNIEIKLWSSKSIILSKLYVLNIWNKYIVSSNDTIKRTLGNTPNPFFPNKMNEILKFILLGIWQQILIPDFKHITSSGMIKSFPLLELLPFCAKTMNLIFTHDCKCPEKSWNGFRLITSFKVTNSISKWQFSI